MVFVTGLSIGQLGLPQIHQSTSTILTTKHTSAVLLSTSCILLLLFHLSSIIQNQKNLFEKHTITKHIPKNDLTAVHVIKRSIDLQSGLWSAVTGIKPNS